VFLPLLVAMLEVPDDSVDAVDAVDDVDSDDAFDDCSKSKCWAKVNDVKLGCHFLGSGFFGFWVLGIILNFPEPPFFGARISQNPREFHRTQKRPLASTCFEFLRTQKRSLAFACFNFPEP
jgi:hypothetical protein